MINTYEHSPGRSPRKKRQRMSSPTYDSQLDELSQEQIAAFDVTDITMSQSPKKDNNELSTRQPRQPVDDNENPFISRLIAPRAIIPEFKVPSSVSGFSSASGFASASAFASSSSLIQQLPERYERSPSPEEYQEKDYSSWFEADSETLQEPVGFQSAMFASASAFTSAKEVEVPAVVGFMKASTKAIIQPSKDALDKAKVLIERWQDDSIKPDDAVVEESPLPPSAATPRPILHTLESATPGTPSPVVFTRPLTTRTTTTTSTLGGFSSLTTPSQFNKGKGKAKPFKSPLINPSLINAAGPSTFTSSPLNPSRTTAFTPASSFTSAASHRPSIAPPPSLPRTTHPMTPMRPMVYAPKQKFTTPFKAGMRPGEAGRSQLVHQTRQKDIQQSQSQKVSAPTPLKNVVNQFSVFDLSPVSNRMTLSEAGFMPQSYSIDELNHMGIAYAELIQITPTTALYFAFNTPHSTPDYRFPQSTVEVGAQQAYEGLIQRGCTLATKPWVDNHYPLILWKLAGMVALDPETERDPEKKRWCWREVIRQLLYRYERDLNSSSRPPLRLIATMDSPASLPMVLCVSGITWSEGGITEDGVPVLPHPELELTDGWYRLRAQVDEPLTRAARKGILRIGRKIACAGARLENTRKEPSEILEAYESTSLVLTGNGSHLAPWNAKLGFQRDPFVATLRSLTADGGLVAVLDVVVVRTHPVAYFEFFEDEDGQKQRKGPLGKQEEAQLAAQWEKKREIEAGKLRAEIDVNIHRYEGYIDRLERRAGSLNPGNSDSMPDYIQGLYEELEDPIDASAVLSRASQSEAAWLARLIRQKLEADGEVHNENIERDLQHTCPPRNVRSFRVIIVQDSITRRHNSHRSAQLTVWDALTVNFGDDGGNGADPFAIGGRYMVTNLIPTQLTAWMDDEPGSEIFLSTRRDSRWTKLKKNML